MRELIKGQTIRFDAHKRGDGQPTAWGDGVHLHKVMNNDRYNRAEVLIPIDNADDVEFRKVIGKTRPIKRRITKEISNALNKNPQKRKEFIETLFREIDRYSESMTVEERRGNLIAGAKRVAKHFGLKDSFMEEVNDNLDQCLSGHKDENEKVCWMLRKLKAKSMTVILGENKDLVQAEKLLPVTNV